MKSYIFADNFTLKREESGCYSAFDLSVATGILTGSLFQGKTNEGHAMMSGVDGMSWIIPHTLTNESAETLTSQYNCPCYSPMLDEQFARALMRSYPMIVNPIVIANGVLVGQWRVESNGLANGVSVTSALTHNLPELFVTQAENMLEAIILNGLMQAGVGSSAYMYFQDDMESYDLVYISQQTAEVVKREPFFWAYCVRVEELDKYAVIGAPKEDISLALEKAKLELVIQVSEYKRDSDQLLEDGKTFR
ncbi:hypothetical protein [Yersinia ruckeri]|uniref:hypothetical protein n=1 Tax=Yersinia ruckeri TaxID=29486 RepID=UPI0020BE6671|nr:hypothetical protein [Yersinia ruckeri]MCK8586387.1 hypothetical protein [Yersinia ruckeri]MCW6615629.1 hypothetical protein [Yersinia ruckeri]